MWNSTLLFLPPLGTLKEDTRERVCLNQLARVHVGVRATANDATHRRIKSLSKLVLNSEQPFNNAIPLRPHFKLLPAFRSLLNQRCKRGHCDAAKPFPVKSGRVACRCAADVRLRRAGVYYGVWAH